MARTSRVVIVGGGVEGLSTAWALTRRGVAEIMLLERADLCGGATAKSSGVVRCHYGVRSLAAMAWQGTQALEQAGEELGSDVGFVQTGYVVGVAEHDVAAMTANVAMQQRLGIDVRVADRDEVAELWPPADLDDFAAFAYEPRGGYGDAYRTGQAFAAAARRAGAVVRQRAPVVRICVDAADRITGVELAGGERVGADAVVVAAGAWSAGLCAGVGIDLPIRAQREQILLVDPGAPVGEVPVFSDLVGLQYVRIEGSGALLVGNSDHAAPEYADPDAYVDRADDSYIEAAAAKLTHRLPGLAAPALSHSYSGCYDVTPDFNPIIGPAPVGGLFLAAGFSGHGYKISPAVGELLADLLLIGHSSDPAVAARDFRLERFVEGDSLVSEHPYVAAGQMR